MFFCRDSSFSTVKVKRFLKKLKGLFRREKRLYRLGYSLKPMREKEVTVEALTRAFADMDDAEKIKRAEEIASIANSENATIDTAKYLAEIIEQK